MGNPVSKFTDGRSGWLAAIEATRAPAQSVGDELRDRATAFRDRLNEQNRARYGGPTNSAAAICA